MILRKRDPLVRLLGLGLLYAAVLLVLIWLPALDLGKVAAGIVIAGAGAALARGFRSWWCPQCWYSHR